MRGDLNEYNKTHSLVRLLVEYGPEEISVRDHSLGDCCVTMDSGRSFGIHIS